MALTAEESVEELTEQLVLNGRLNKAINIWFPQFGYCTENIMCVCVNVQILVSDYNYGQEWKQSTAVIFRKMIKHMRKLLKSKRYWHWNAKTVGVAGRWYLSAPTVTPLSLSFFSFCLTTPLLSPLSYRPVIESVRDNLTYAQVADSARLFIHLMRNGSTTVLTESRS